MLERTSCLFVTLLVCVACGPPSAPPVRFDDVTLTGSVASSWCAHFTLRDASGDVTTMEGELTYSVRDAAGSEICRLSAPTFDSTYLESEAWHATRCTEPSFGLCPPLTSVGERRTVVLTLTAGTTTVTSDAVDAPAEMFQPPPAPPIVAPTPPVVPTPVEPVVAPSAPEGWVVSSALHARVNAPGATASPASTTPMGASDVVIIGASDDCRVELGRWPTLAVNGASIRARSALHADPITIDEVTAERWHLEYEHEGYLYLNVGVVEPGGATAIVCRVDYPTGRDASRACSAAICASLELDPAL